MESGMVFEASGSLLKASCQSSGFRPSYTGVD